MPRPLGEALDCVVVGGGITGLCAAHRLTELGRERGAPLKVRVLEGADRLGGQIRTERVGDYLIDGGPDSLVTHKPAAVRLAERIGLASDLVSIGASDGGTEVLRDGRPVRLPAGFSMLAPTRWGPLLRSPLFSIRGKLRMACEPWIARRAAEVEDESLASFVTRRFGREVLDRVAEPIVAGLFTARAECLSVRMALPRFFEMEARDGSIVRGLRAAARLRSRQGAPGGNSHAGAGFVALEGGLGRLVEALGDRLPNDGVETGVRVEAIARDRARGAWRVRTAGGRELHADTVVLACSATASASIVRALDARLSSSLAELEYASCATVTVAYPRAAIRAPLRSFGFFVPRSEGQPILACSYVGRKFEDRGPRETMLLRAFLGGAVNPAVLEGDDAQLERLTHETLARVLDIRQRPVLARVHRFPASMPQYRPGQAEWIAGIRARVAESPGLFVAGSTLGAVGLPDCTQSGEDVATAVFELLRGRMSAAEPVPIQGQERIDCGRQADALGGR